MMKAELEVAQTSSYIHSEWVFNAAFPQHLSTLIML